MMNRVSVAAVAALLLIVPARPSSASPLMIRLGYPTCESCHLTPQGGGLLTPYGRGVDATQNLRPEELSGDAIAGTFSRLTYDARFTMTLDRPQATDSTYGFTTLMRAAMDLAPHQRLVYALNVASPTLAATGTNAAVTAKATKIFWLFQPKPGLSIVVGRDDLPTGLGLPTATAFNTHVTSPDESSTPTQAKLFWWNKRWQVTTYGFGPDGNEAAPEYRAYGAGALVAADVWRNRAVVGMTTRASYATAYDRTNAGAFLRLGLSKHWGVLLEHDVTARTTATGDDFTHVAGISELFFVPFDWLYTTVAAEDVVTLGGDHTYRLTPTAQVRLTKNVTILFNTRDVYTGTSVGSARSRTYSLQFSIKTVG